MNRIRNKRRRTKLIMGFVFCVMYYYFARFLVHSTRYILDTSEKPFNRELSPEYMTIESSPALVSRCEKVIHVASVVVGSMAARECSLMMKTLFHSRRDGIQLYLITDHQARAILRTLLVTWDLPYVNVLLISGEHLVPEYLERAKWSTFLQSTLPYILKNHTEKVIYLSSAVRLLNRIDHLWDLFQYFGSQQIIGLVPYHIFDPTGGIDGVHVALLDVVKMRKVFPDMTSFRSLSPGQQQLLMAQYMKASVSTEPFWLMCSWGVRFSQSFNMDKCFGGDQIHAFIHDTRTKKLRIITDSLKAFQSILSSESDVYGEHISSCPTVPQPTNPHPSDDVCREYRYASEIKRRTHPFYVSAEPVSSHGVTDVTLVTIMTLDRFTTFERLVSHWDTAVIAVVHATDEEGLVLVDKVSNSTILARRRDVSFHIVYKQGEYFPINYLRNVGLRDVTTPYVFYVDVDLVPTPRIFTRLQAYIRNFMLNKDDKVALVVPAFEAFETLPNFPRNKTEFISLWDAKKVNGYKMDRKWNLGHKPTDYTKWRTAETPYVAQWKDAFEPYVVLPTRAAPLYREQLLERMGDKIAYGRDLHARGFIFLVIPDLYIVHLPHADSAGTTLWKTKPNYLRCGATIFNEFREILKSNYPHVKF